MHSSARKILFPINAFVGSAQKIKTGTYDDVLGPGSTPLWGSPDDIMKYEEDSLIQRESGYVLNYSVSHFQAPTSFVRFCLQSWKSCPGCTLTASLWCCGRNHTCKISPAFPPDLMREGEQSHAGLVGEAGRVVVGACLLPLRKSCSQQHMGRCQGLRDCTHLCNDYTTAAPYPPPHQVHHLYFIEADSFPD